jgi:hypothetical protein
MKLIVGGTLAVVVALIVAGTASARVLIPSQQQSTVRSNYTSRLLGYPKGVVGAPGLGTAASTPVKQHAQRLTFVGSYSDFPELQRTMALSAASHTTSNNGFDWNDGGIGVGVAIGVASIIGLLAFGIRRSKAEPATA